MAWVWVAIIGGLLAPWVFLPRTLRARFAEDGIRAGLTLWLGACAVTVPVSFMIAWLIFRFG